MRVSSFAKPLLVLSASLVSLTASANAGGVAGYTGKPTAAAPQGESCNQCHGGGTAPQVTLIGPNTLAAGQTAEYSLVVKTGQSRAAGAIAATDGVALIPVSGLRDSFGEMVQETSSAVSGGQAIFTFKVIAPLTGSTLRLWAVGLAANGSGTGGDKASHTTKEVSVSGGGPLPSGADAGSSAGGTGVGATPPGGEVDSGTKSSRPNAGSSGSSNDTTEEASEEGADVDDGPRPRSRTYDGTREPAACSASPRIGSTEVLAALTILAFGATVRRRQRMFP